MKIVVTSPSFSRHPILKEQIMTLGESVKLNEIGVSFDQNALISYIGDAEIAVVSLEKIDHIVLSACPNLKCIAKYGVGIDNIDLNACKDLNIKVIWQPGVNKLSVAELTLCLMLSLMRNVFFSSYQLKNGRWNKAGGCQLTGRTIGLIGVSHVAKEVVRLLKPFGCRILLNDITDISAYAEQESLELVSFDSLIQEADVVSLHMALTAETTGIINKAVFKKMKSTAFIINTARGKLIVESDLKMALMSQEIAGAALDVFSEEPPMDIDFLQLPNLLCTPHIGGSAYEAILAMGTIALNGIKEYLSV